MRSHANKVFSITHLSVTPQHKPDALSLGKTLTINDNDVYEDLDEVMARFITPMRDYIKLLTRQVLKMHAFMYTYSYFNMSLVSIQFSSNHSFIHLFQKYYVDGTVDQVMSRLEEDRMRDPATITYYVCVDRAKPGRLFFCYHTGAKYGLSAVMCASPRIPLNACIFQVLPDSISCHAGRVEVA